MAFVIDLVVGIIIGMVLSADCINGETLWSILNR